VLCGESTKPTLTWLTMGNEFPVAYDFVCHCAVAAKSALTWLTMRNGK
jgi:hypothetical protein